MVKRPHTRMNDEQKEAAFELFKNGMNILDLANAFKTSYHTMYCHIKKKKHESRHLPKIPVPNLSRSGVATDKEAFKDWE